MAQSNPKDGGSGGDNDLGNDGGQPSPNSGNDDWKAKYEALLSEHEQLQKDHKILEQNRNHFRSKAEGLETEKGELAKKVEDIQSEYSEFKDGVEKDKQTQAAKSKQSEILDKYPDNVKKLAEVAGLELKDAEDEDAVKTFTDKLDKIKETAGSAPSKGDGGTPPAPKKPPVGSNNNSPEDNTPPKKAETTEEKVARQEEELAEVTF